MLNHFSSRIMYRGAVYQRVEALRLPDLPVDQIHVQLVQALDDVFRVAEAAEASVEQAVRAHNLQEKDIPWRRTTQEPWEKRKERERQEQELGHPLEKEKVVVTHDIPSLVHKALDSSAQYLKQLVVDPEYREPEREQQALERRRTSGELLGELLASQAAKLSAHLLKMYQSILTRLYPYRTHKTTEYKIPDQDRLLSELTKLRTWGIALQRTSYLSSRS